MIESTVQGEARRHEVPVRAPHSISFFVRPVGLSSLTRCAPFVMPSQIKVDHLGDENWHAWSYKMEMLLKKHGVWRIVTGEEERPYGSDASKQVKGWITRRDLAMAEVVLHLEDAQLPHVRDLDSPKEAWDRLKHVHTSEGRVRVLSRTRKRTRYDSVHYELKYTEILRLCNHRESPRSPETPETTKN